MRNIYIILTKVSTFIDKVEIHSELLIVSLELIKQIIVC